MIIDLDNDPRRVQFLKEGITLTEGDRDKQYGEPSVNFQNCAALFTAYLSGKARGRIIAPTGGAKLNSQYELTAEDVAWLNVLQKMARTFSGQPKDDTYIDAAVYAAIAGECAHDE